MMFDEKDLSIEIYRSDGGFEENIPGKLSSSLRIIHVPSGLVEVCEIYKNKDKAVQKLRERVESVGDAYMKDGKSRVSQILKAFDINRPAMQLRLEQLCNEIQKDAFAAGWKTCQEAAAKEAEKIIPIYIPTSECGRPCGEKIAENIRHLPVPKIHSW